MKKTILVLVLSLVANNQFGQIIADHTSVSAFENIPEQYISEVKKMMVWFAGESHSKAYRSGLLSLEDIDPIYNCSSTWGFQSPTDDLLRVIAGPDYAYGENVWFTWKAYPPGSEPSDSELFKGYIKSNADEGNPISVLGSAWCWDMVDGSNEGGIDPEQGVHWYGASIGGPEGNEPWGLNSEDQSITGNSVCMDTYLAAMEDYISFCKTNGYSTKIVFTTGPVDSYTGEEGYQVFLKHEYIRNYVSQDSTRILFDYADILCYDNDETITTTSWDGHTYPIITTSNLGDESIGHIGEEGAIRLAKAQWWLFARLAGWDGNAGVQDIEPPSIPTGLTLTSSSANSVLFSWILSTDNVGVVGYNVYRDGTFLESTAGTSYIDNTVSGCADYSYSVSAIDASGNESAQSEALVVNPCAPDVTPTITLSPNVANGVTFFELIVRVTELNGINTSGDIVVHIPKDQHWDLSETYDPSLASLGGTSLNNNEWSYSENTDNHIFTSSSSILAGSNSTFGFRISFDPGSSTGMNPITTQLVSGGGGEVHVSNNSDSEQLDYFQ